MILSLLPKAVRDLRKYVSLRYLIGSLLIFSGGLLIYTLLFMGIRQHDSTAFLITYQEMAADTFVNASLDNYPESQIFTVLPDGSRPLAITTLEEDIIKSSYTWSRDAESILFVRQHPDEFSALYTANFGDNIEADLGDGKYAYRDPRFSPNGEHLAIVRNFRVIVLHPDDMTTEIYNSGGDANERNYYPRWSADAKYLAYIRNDESDRWLVIVDIETATEKLIHASDYEFSGVSNITWSPKNHTIAAQVTPPWSNTSIVLIDALTGDFRYLNDEWFLQSAPHWSADGEWIYFVGVEEPTTAFGGVYRMRLQDGLIQSLPINLTVAAEIYMAPDGESIYYNASIDNSISIVRTTPAGNDPQAITSPNNFQVFPILSPIIDRDWHPSSLFAVPLIFAVSVGIASRIKLRAVH